METKKKYKIEYIDTTKRKIFKEHDSLNWCIQWWRQHGARRGSIYEDGKKVFDLKHKKIYSI